MDLTYGMKDGRLVHISEVERGSKCGCTCPDCGSNLTSVKNDKSEHHFKHYKKDRKTPGAVKPFCNADYGMNAALYIMAKEILEKEGRIHIPKIEFTTDHKFPPKGIVEEGMLISIDKVDFCNGTEMGLNVHSAGRRLGIQLNASPFSIIYQSEYGSNPLDRSGEYSNNELVSLIEVRTAFNDGIISKDGLKTALLGESENKRWLLNRLNEWYVDRLLELSDKIYIDDEDDQNMTISDCPLHSSSTNRVLPFEETCLKCKYLQQYNVDLQYVAVTPIGERYYIDYRHIYCSAKSGIVTFDDLKKRIPKDEIPYISDSLDEGFMEYA